MIPHKFLLDLNVIRKSANSAILEKHTEKSEKL